MAPFRFSPIKTETALLKAIEHIHVQSYKLCKNAFGHYFNNAGNVGIFCHYDDEYNFLTTLRKEMCEPSSNPDQKYFKLHNPVIIPAKDDVPETIYEYLYIRKPSPFEHQVGDIDFYMKADEYEPLKKEMLSGKKIQGARVYDRPDLDMIELYNPEIDVLAYISTPHMSDLVRVKQSEHTNL